MKEVEVNTFLGGKKIPIKIFGKFLGTKKFLFFFSLSFNFIFSSYDCCLQFSFQRVKVFVKFVDCNFIEQYCDKLRIVTPCIGLTSTYPSLKSSYNIVHPVYAWIFRILLNFISTYIGFHRHIRTNVKTSKIQLKHIRFGCVNAALTLLWVLPSVWQNFESQLITLYKCNHM